MKKDLPKSIRTYIRRQKATIRKSAMDKIEEKKLIKDFLDRFYKVQEEVK